MTQTRKVLHTPVSLHRVGGHWSQIELCDAHVPGHAIEAADRPEPGEEPGYGEKMVYVKGHKYELSDDIAQALAGTKVLLRTTIDSRRVVSFVGSHIYDEELPAERRERIVSPASPTFTPAQLAHIEALMAARMAELGLDRQEVAL